jgi:signal peptidase I
MSSILGLSESANPNSGPEPSAPRSGSLSKRLSAALLSGIIPGVGQMLFGRVRSGTLFLAAFVAALALFWPLRLPEWYLGFCALVIILAAVSIAAAWHAARSADDKSAKLPGWWLLLVVPLAYLGSNFDANPAMRLAGFQLFNIPSSAMENTLIIGDRIVVDRNYYRNHTAHVGDVAVFRREHIWEVKRIIALGGDRIYGRAGIIYRNDQPLWEAYVIHTIGAANSFPNTNDFGPITLLPGQIFVMGDNRDVSYDSRQPKHGPIYLSAESGKPLYIVWSPIHRRIGGAVH